MKSTVTASICFAIWLLISIDASFASTLKKEKNNDIVIYTREDVIAMSDSYPAVGGSTVTQSGSDPETIFEGALEEYMRKKDYKSVEMKFK